MIAKLFTDTDYKKRLIHETTIASILNTIGDKTPNFIYFYGFIQNYCLYEYINGMTLEDWLQDKQDEKDILSIIIQVLLSIEIAAKEFNFTHFDLNMNNIMIIELNKERNLNYILDEHKFSIKSRYIVKIIDFEFSTIMYQNHHYFFEENFIEDIGLNNEYCHCKDIIKFLSYLYLLLIKSNHNTTLLENKIKEILSLFLILDESLNEYVEEYCPYFDNKKIYIVKDYLWNQFEREQYINEEIHLNDYFKKNDIEYNIYPYDKLFLSKLLIDNEMDKLKRGKGNPKYFKETIKRYERQYQIENLNKKTKHNNYIQDIEDYRNKVGI